MIGVVEIIREDNQVEYFVALSGSSNLSIAKNIN